MSCTCAHGDTTSVTEGVVFCNICKRQIYVRKCYIDDVAVRYGRFCALLKQPHRPPPEEYPELKKEDDRVCR